MDKVLLKGITWGHSRGITPLLAASQRFSELYPAAEIQWDKRTLQAFADYPIEKLVESYDLLIIDHPWVGCAAATECVLPLEKYLASEFLEDQAKNSVGLSHPSYFFGGHQWALAIDAATPVASYRYDLLEENRVPIPVDWMDVLAIAKKGKLAIPSIPIDLLMHFYMFCIASGKEPFLDDDEVIDSETGTKALHSMVELWAYVDKKMFGYNPIQVAELMSSTDSYWYCPFAYGYSNYSRNGYARSILTYGNLVRFDTDNLLRSTLGGTGLSVSAFSKNKEVALRFAEWVTGTEIQSTLYLQHGGQPGHRTAWKNELGNMISNDFFKNTLSTLDNAFVRPRYNGYLHFQDMAGIPLQKYLEDGGRPESVLNEMNDLYRKSKKSK